MQQLELSLLTHRNKHALYAVNILFLLQGLAKDSGYCFVSAAVAACLVYVLSAAPVSWQQVAKAAVSNGGKPPGTTAITRQQPANWGRRKMVEGGRGGGGGGGGVGGVGGGWVCGLGVWGGCGGVCGLGGLGGVFFGGFKGGAQFKAAASCV